MKEGIEQGKEYYGFVSYDYKNHLENLQSEHTALINFPDFFFFEPETVIMIEDLEVLVYSDVADQVFDEITCMELDPAAILPIEPKPLTTKLQYISHMEELVAHIHRGDIYEMNYCVAFSAEQVTIDPARLYYRLMSQSEVPFACMVKYHTQYLLCASPERYFKTEGNRVVSQPIKGTARVKDLSNTHQERLQLQQSAKERNENVMIVDLVRNDLSKICEAGTVKVEELYGVYQFGHLYQMISTISGLLPAGKTWMDVLEATFPMGSMTGAPKYKSMQLIESCENFKRNIYSGTVGHIAAGGDADFNVVIRSIFYDYSVLRLSFAVGSGITALSNADQEYEECLLKAESILRILKGGGA